MKNVLRLLLMAAALGAALALPAFAQDTAGGATAAQCTADADAKAALYKTFLANYKGTPEQQKTAYDTGRQYLDKYGNCPDDSDKQIASFIQKWIGKYEEAVLKFNCTDALSKKNYQNGFTACRQWLDAHPEDNGVLLALAGASYNNAIDKATNKSLYPDSVTYTRRALQAAEGGKITDFSPYFKSRDEAIGLFDYTLALLLRESSPKEATDYLLKAVQSNSIFKTESSAYYFLGGLYYNNEVTPMVADYKAKFEGKPETPESKAALDAINVVLDRVIDAFARAVALSKDATTKKTYMDQLTAIYKSRHDGTDTGLNELVASVLNKPLPIPGQAPPPTPTPSTSSATTSGADGVSTTGTTARPAATTTNTGNGAKPAATPASTTKPAVQKPPRR